MRRKRRGHQEEKNTLDNNRWGKGEEPQCTAEFACIASMCQISPTPIVCHHSDRNRCTDLISLLCPTPPLLLCVLLFVVSFPDPVRVVACAVSCNRDRSVAASLRSLHQPNKPLQRNNKKKEHKTNIHTRGINTSYTMFVCCSSLIFVVCVVWVCFVHRRVFHSAETVPHLAQSQRKNREEATVA